MKRTMLVEIPVLFLLWAVPVLADGFIVLHPPRPEIRPIPLSIKYHHVKVKIEDELASTSIDQVFVNPNNMQLEGTYIFPLPEGATVSKMSMWIDGKEVSAELLPRDEAVRIYTDIVRKMKDPAILEYMGGRMFRLRIFPIEARGEKRIKISYTERLERDAGLLTYRYPLSTEKFSSKPLEEVLVDLSITSSNPLKALFSPSHDVEVVRKGDCAAHVGYEAKNVTPDTDFVFYCAGSSEPFGVNLVTHKEKTQDGYFALFLAPDFTIDVNDILPKDVVFVVDTSGSMKEPAKKPWKIDQVKEALCFCVNSLNRNDRFNVIAFSTVARSFRKTLQPVTDDTRAEAGAFIKAIEARGGTNIDEALRTALALQDQDGSRPFIVVFLTDGQPTVGNLQKAEDLVAFARKNAGPGTRMFTFGVGYDVNTHLLDKLARENRGDRIYVSPEERIEVKVSAFYDKISNPVLSDIEIAVDSIDTYDLFPPRIPDLFRGSQRVLYGRYKGDGHSAVRLTGSMHDSRNTWVYEVCFPEKNESHSHIPRLWARSKIGYLLDQLRLKGIDPTSGFKPSGPERELVDEIVALATEFGIVTPYTAMLVLEDDWNATTPRTPAARLFREKRKNEAFDQEVSVSRESLGWTTGKGSVDLSRATRTLQEGRPVSGTGGSEIFDQVLQPEKTFKHLTDKTFVLVDDVWYDSRYRSGMETRKIAFLSDAYFALIAENPGLARYLSLGDRVVVMHEGTAFEITR